MAELAAAIKDIPLPARMRKLPISDRGFPIPAFVAWLDESGQVYLPAGSYGAKRDFRVIDSGHLDRVFRLKRCWICDEPLGRHKVFAIGPMCVVNRVTMEPPSHRECAEYAVKACPFMMNPRTRRNEKGIDDEMRSSVPGIHLDRNPGAYCLYETREYRRFRPPIGEGMLCRLGPPDRVDWFSQGRPATRAEVTASIDSGMPILMKLAVAEGEAAVRELKEQRAAAERLLPWPPGDRKIEA